MNPPIVGRRIFYGALAIGGYIALMYGLMEATDAAVRMYGKETIAMAFAVVVVTLFLLGISYAIGTAIDRVLSSNDTKGEST